MRVETQQRVGLSARFFLIFSLAVTLLVVPSQGQSVCASGTSCVTSGPISGSQTIYTVAADAAGNSTQSATVSVAK
jgi:hypothetical protein